MDTVKKSKEKRKKQLGMDYGTASGRLRKMLMFNFAVDAGHKCYRCGEDLKLTDFSVEHKVPWLNSESPVKLFFDINNIAYSHQSCNSAHNTGGGLLKTPEEKRQVKKDWERRWREEHGHPRNSGWRQRQKEGKAVRDV